MDTELVGNGRPDAVRTETQSDVLCEAEGYQ